MAHDYNDDGFGGSPHTSNGFEAMKRNEYPYVPPVQPKVPAKLWLWKNFVDGRQEYWAFDNLYPCYPNGDPMVLGEPCGYAIFKPSVNGRPETTRAGDE
jgi:hypothetical protein